jgi:hypothetical protein
VAGAAVGGLVFLFLVIYIVILCRRGRQRTRWWIRLAGSSRRAQDKLLAKVPQLDKVRPYLPIFIDGD